MTRKDFELIAQTLSEYRGEGADEVLDALTQTFARKLSNTNAQFNYARFVATAKGGN